LAEDAERIVYIKRLEAEIAAKKREQVQAAQYARSLEAALEAAQGSAAKLAALENSTSWRITRPLRVIADFVRRTIPTR
jgi:hypothetical protein